MRRLFRRLWYWARSGARAAALGEEIEFHREMKQRELERAGLAPRDAASEARRAMGNAALAAEDARAVWALPSIDTLAQDVRHGMRILVRHPGFTLAAASILALGIGVTTAMFTVADALLFRPVPFADPDRLASVYMGTDRGGRLAVHPEVLRAWRESGIFAGVEAANPDIAVVGEGDGAVTRGIARVSPGLFEMLGGIRPVRGRLFAPGEGAPGADDRVLIAEDLWRGLYHADPSLPGRRIIVDGEPLTVVGILPSDFRFPRWDTQIWRATDFTRVPAASPARWPRPYVRFSDRLPRADAERRATDLARAADAQNAARALTFRPRPLAGLLLDPYYQRALPLLGAGVVFVFLTLCANLCSLLLARLTVRRREFGLCSALGASRGRLVRQALVEHACLGAIGAAGGLALAWALVSVARAFVPDALMLRTLNAVDLDPRALGFASAVSVAGTALIGLLPAWLGTRPDSGATLRVVDRGGTETRSARLATRTLLVAEIALACTLLTGATLLVRSFVNLSRADRGLDARGVVTVKMTMRAPALGDRAGREAAAAIVEDRVRALPGVRETAWSYGTPPDGGGFSIGDWQSDVPGAAPVNMRVEHYDVGPDFFALYRIPILRGRTFRAGDTSRQVIVGERLAGILWPGSDPLGRTFRFERTEYEVIGVAREIHFPSIDPRGLDVPEFYAPFAGVGSFAMLNIRCEAACPDPAVFRQRIASAHPAIHIAELDPLEDMYVEQVARPRAAAALGLAFAGIALLAAGGGLFSVLTYTVARRRREFGIRAALGASPAQIRRAVLRDGAGVAAAGLVIGSFTAWLLGRALSSLQYGVTASDPASWALVIGVLACTALGASWRPAREAVRVDPVHLLRDE